MSVVSTAVAGLSELYPYDVEVSEELRESVAFIDTSFTPETIVRAGYGGGVVALFVPLPAALFLPVPLPYVLFFALVLALATAHTVHSMPHLLAAFRRTRALGDTPNLIGRAVLRMEVQPALETAVRFAADTGYGPLAESLRSHIDRSMGTPNTGLLSFADDWSGEFPALRRSAHLLATAENAPEGERVRTLDRALSAILDGTREQMAEFTNAIRGPTTALYAFGVMLPLALIALVPATAIAGFRVNIWMFVLLYNLVLPGFLVAASVWLLRRRPVAFPPPDVDRSHPDVENRPLLTLSVGPVVGGTVGGLTYTFGPPYLAAVAGVGTCAGSFLLAYFHPVKAVRDYVRAVEEHLVDALYLVGRQVSEGEAAETAIEQAADRVPAETGEVFEQAAGIQRRLHVSVDEAFFGDHGALTDVPSPRARGTASLLSIAADEGQPAGRAIVSMADHLEELQEVENEAKRQLAKVTGTLDNTASYFGPLVAGSTVAMADGMVGAGGLKVMDTSVKPLPTSQLGVVVGLYVIAMAVILTALSIGLRHGLDRSLVGYHVGRALVFALPLYVLSVAMVGQMI